jgi:hypothetical protein
MKVVELISSIIHKMESLVELRLITRAQIICLNSERKQHLSLSLEDLHDLKVIER